MYPGWEATATTKRELSPQRWNVPRRAPGGFRALGSATGRSIVVLSGFLLVACASLGGRRNEDPNADDGVSMNDGAIILTGSVLQAGSGNLLAAMRGQVPNFRVIRNVRKQCPQISLRNNANIPGYFVNPNVYVDGTRTTNTCVLESLRSSDVERVEVYPQGITKRPGYAGHAEGLILVFMRSS